MAWHGMAYIYYRVIWYNAKAYDIIRLHYHHYYHPALLSSLTLYTDGAIKLDAFYIVISLL